MKLLFFILLSLISLTSFAEIFKSTDAQGNITYSDTPMGDKSERIELPEAGEPEQATPSTIKTSSGVDTSTPSTDKKNYTKFAIITPGDQATIQNQPIIFVDVEVDPALQKGDKIQIYLDGNPVTPLQDSTHFEFLRPDRGTHQLSAKLFDENHGIIKETTSYTIYVHQTHV